jgi:integrase
VHVERLYGSLLKSGTGVRTVLNVQAVLHRSLEKAVRYCLILRNSTNGAALPQYRHAEMMVLDETQSKSGTPLDPSNLRLDFSRVLRQAGLPKIRFHDLRHTAASLMLNNGVPVLVVSKMLGHSKPSITMDIHGHLYNEMQDKTP